MKTRILSIFFFVTIFKVVNGQNTLEKTYQNNYETNALNKISIKVLLDSICNYLLISNSIKNSYYYSADRKIFSNKLIDKGGMNSGFISIDTLNKSIRFNYTGTTGSGGFAPYIQQTFYFQDLSSFYWNEKNEKIKNLHLISSYDNCNGNFKPIAEFEEESGCKGSEDKIVSMPDYTRNLYSERELVFNIDKLTEEVKSKLSNWFNELKKR